MHGDADVEQAPTLPGRLPPNLDILGDTAYDIIMNLHRVVIDTNVLISGTRSRKGASFKVISLIGTGRFDTCVSVPLVLEYEKRLLDPGSGVPLSGRDVQELLDYVCSVSEQCEVFYLWRPFLRDPKDDMVLEVAVAAGCRYIITFNERDFAGADRFGIRIIKPKRFLALLGEKK